jgi:hypothetical protein
MMMRSILVVGCALGFMLAAPAGFEAAAAKGKACVASTMDGKKTKWQCRTGQKCCFNWLMNKGGCVAASEICL